MAKLHNFIPQISNKILFLQNFAEFRQLHSIVSPVNSVNILNMLTNNDLSNCLFLRFNQTKPLKCWKCGVEKSAVTDVFCPKCNFIQEPHETKNFFKLLDIDETFDLDLKALTRKYRKFQTEIHPDKFSGKSAEERNISEEYSSLVNKAYSTLQTPLNRALHILQLKGERIDEDQKITDPEFLMEIMELNEEIEEAKGPEKLKALNEQNKKTIEEISYKISENFKKGDIQTAKEYIIKMKYYNSVSLHINGILRERGIVD